MKFASGKRYLGRWQSKFYGLQPGDRFEVHNSYEAVAARAAGTKLGYRVSTYTADGKQWVEVTALPGKLRGVA